MQYDSIILELMSRIKKLEDDVAELKAQKPSPQKAAFTEDTLGEFTSSEISADYNDFSYEEKRAPSSYGKTTEQMIDLCYELGKKAYLEKRTNFLDVADEVNYKTGMNKSSAFIYLGVVKCLLEGTVYKRAINFQATKKYFSAIYSDFGAAGLQKALNATRAHTQYRKSCGVPVDYIEKLCDEFQKKLY